MEQKIRQDVNIGTNIRKFRNESGLTQGEVAIKLQLFDVDISRSTYSQIECGTCNIRVSVLLALSQLFQIPIGDFFKDLSIPKSNN